MAKHGSHFYRHGGALRRMCVLAELARHLLLPKRTTEENGCFNLSTQFLYVSRLCKYTAGFSTQATGLANHEK